MQIIQTLRDKGGIIVIVVIALSLIGFILMDSRTGSENSARSLAATVGSINGEKIELGEFNKRVDLTKMMQEQNSRQPVPASQMNQVRENTWQQLVAEKLFFKEAAKLGIDLSPKELSTILFSNDQNNPLMQEASLKDSLTGQLDPAKVQDALKKMKTRKAEERQAYIEARIAPLRLNSVAQKYNALISAGGYYANWMKQRDEKMNAEFAVIQYVSIPYTDISDSAVTVSDADINAYIAKNKELFKQEEGRRISYVTFSQNASAADSTELMTQMTQLKSEFAADSNARAFVALKGSIIDYNDVFITKAKQPTQYTDSIVAAPRGTVTGPFVDGGAMILAKVIDSKEMPDSAAARHILIGTINPQTQQPIRDDAVAKKLADSLLTAIKAGANFTALALQYSDDQVSKIKGGDLGNFAQGTMVPEFNDFVFEKPIGAMEVVKTQFGYHIINVTNKSNFAPAYKIAYLAKDLVPSSNTINKASTDAAKASAQPNGKALLDYAAKNGLGITKEPTPVKPDAYQIGSLADARQVVKWIYEAEVGDVSEPFNLDDKFVVVTVDKIEKEGVQDAATARPNVEAAVRIEKKAAIIKAKLGANPTLESAMQAYGKQIETAGADSSITMFAQMIPNLGLENKLIGAAFNKDYAAKASPAIQGTSGVFVIKTQSINSKGAMPEADKAKFLDTQKTAARNVSGVWFESLKEQADIKDNRGKYM